MAKITYTDKTTANTSPLPTTQKFTSGDANEIKASVNALYDEKADGVALQTSAATSITLDATYFGKITRTSAATTVTVMVPNGLALGLTTAQFAGFRQGGAGQVVFVTSGGAVLNNATGAAATYGLYATAYIGTTTILDTYNLSGQVG